MSESLIIIAEKVEALARPKIPFAKVAKAIKLSFALSNFHSQILQR